MLKKLGIFLMVLAMTCSSMDILTNVAYASVEANQTETQEEVPNPTLANETSNEDSVIGQDYEGLCESAKAITQTIIQPRMGLLNDSFSVTFTVDTARYLIDSYSYETNGFKVVSDSLFGNEQIAVQLKANNETESPIFTLHIELQDGSYVEPQVFGYVNEYGIFLSNASYDDAWSYHLEYLKSQDIVAAEEANQMQIEQTKANVEEEIYTEDNSGPVTMSSANTWVKGRLQWRDDNGVLHPLQYTALEVWDDDAVFDDLLGEFFTDENGDYVCAFENQTIATEQGGCDPYIKVYAIGVGYNIVIDRSYGSGYSTESSHISNVSTGSTTTINMTFTMDNDLGRAFQILQAAVTTTRYVTAMNSTSTNLGTVRIQYPDSGKGCYYQSNRIYITASAPQAGMPQSYASWDVIAHEYGHHVQHLFGITESPGGGHYINVSMSDHYAGTDHVNCGCVQPGAEQAKYQGIRLAWGESWNTVLGIRAQQYYSSILKNINTVGDNSYTSYNGVNYSLENPSYSYYRGEGCEATNCAVLYDLCDAANEPHDSVSMGDYQFFNVTVTSQAKTLSEFINYCTSNNKVNSINMGKILSHYEIAPNGFRTTTGITKSPPTFSWNKGNGISSSKYQNNKFQVAFFDSTGKEILRTSEISSTSYTLSENEWNNVLYSYGSTFKAAVYGYQTSYPSTGGYLSNTVEYTKPIAAPMQESISITNRARYTERTVNLLPGQYVDYTITFATAGSEVFQTFGPLDSHLSIYDSAGTLLASNDDSGYSLNALISYNVQANVPYIVRVKFYNSSVSGAVKFAVMPSRLAYTNYEGIENIAFEGGLSGHGGSRWLYLNRVNLYTITTDVQYTFNVHTETQTGDPRIDTYLYLIDPTSTAPCISNDDGGGNLQASIETQLRPNIPYLLILSAYDITTQEGRVFLSISR